MKSAKQKESSDNVPQTCFAAASPCEKIKNIAVALAGFAAMAFFCTGTWGIIWAHNFIEEKVPIYEPLWTQGFANWNNVAGSVEELNDTLTPAVKMSIELFPVLVDYMSEMNGNVAGLNNSVYFISRNVNHLAAVIPNQMGQMNNNVREASPFSGMPMPWQ